MSTYLVLVFHAPLQSWGGACEPSPNSESPRVSESAPTRSGVIGVIRSALGETGERDSLGLRSGRLLVRSDRPGTLTRDYRTIQRTHSGFSAGSTIVSPAMALQDATFLALVSMPNNHDASVAAQALQSPTWAPFLGRRAYPPSLPVYAGTVNSEDPRQTIEELPVFWGAEEGGDKDVVVRDSWQDGGGGLSYAQDHPDSLNPADHAYSVSAYQQITFCCPRPTRTSIVRQFGALVKMLNK